MTMAPSSPYTPGSSPPSPTTRDGCAAVTRRTPRRTPREDGRRTARVSRTRSNASRRDARDGRTSASFETRPTSTREPETRVHRHPTPRTRERS